MTEPPPGNPESTLGAFPEACPMGDVELYTGKNGYHGLVPMDVMHTIPHGVMLLLKDVMKAYATQSKSKHIMAVRL